MKTTRIFFVLFALFTTSAFGIVCQAGEVFGTGDAACSADCIAKGQGFHGGFCDDHQVCNCTH
ncbi:hypothetical protein P691DRAFT_737575 [Macrolepiota fuliginosa MF-IS2]|uniref:Invertebrate defensins family profile domain-containing protein n=1 Tax=Macrolepiota fuliginosa MF-IS2 TaxID=1400762 RepID=A0A9P5X410_9AGAR|nr:hypothetical protein P691DRAFT_737575 [Macrolepiota fuliginosa MF-IS2]